MKKDLVVHEVFINREADRKKAALEQWLQMMGTRWTGKEGSLCDAPYIAG